MNAAFRDSRLPFPVRRLALAVARRSPRDSIIHNILPRSPANLFIPEAKGKMVKGVMVTTWRGGSPG